MMKGDPMTVDATISKLVFDGMLTQTTNLIDSFGPILELRELFTELSLEAPNE